MKNSVVIEMSKRLRSVPDVEYPSDACQFRLYANYDQQQWLAMRLKAFDQLATATRDWTRADFSREFRRQDQIWFALDSADSNAENAVGSIAIQRIDLQSGEARLNWLMVLPSHRSRGIGAALVRNAERECRRLGIQTIRLSTLSTWERAVRLYRSLGYQVQ